MKHLFAKLLSALLIASLLLSPIVSLAENDEGAAIPAETETEVTTPAGDNSAPADQDAPPEDEEESDIVIEAVDTYVGEADSADLPDDPSDTGGESGLCAEAASNDVVSEGAANNNQSLYYIWENYFSTEPAQGNNPAPIVFETQSFVNNIRADRAAAGETVTVKVIVHDDSKVEFKGLTAYKTNASVPADLTTPRENVPLTPGGDNLTYSFTMPAMNVGYDYQFAYRGSDTSGGSPEPSGSAPDMTNAIPIDEAHFPDPAFRRFLVEYLHSDMLTQDFRENILDLKLCTYVPGTFELRAENGMGITSLQGIQYFTNLRMLDCSKNPIASLDVSGMSELKTLRCCDCGMTSLNVSGCGALRTLWIDGNNLASVDLQSNPVYAGFPKRYQIGYFTKYIKGGACKFAKDKSNARFIQYSKINTDIEVFFDAKTKVIMPGGKTNVVSPSTEPAGFEDVPGATPATVTVSARSTAKNTIASVVAVPGAKTRLNLGGAKGKKFKPSNRKVAAVNGAGVVTFKKGGKVKITYKVGKKARKVTLTVTDPTVPGAVTIAPVNTAVKKGESVTLTPGVNEGANPGGYKWKSSNKKVATVKNGVVKFRKAGRVTITCTTKRGKKKARVTFAVSK